MFRSSSSPFLKAEKLNNSASNLLFAGPLSIENSTPEQHDILVTDEKKSKRKARPTSAFVTRLGRLAHLDQVNIQYSNR